MGRCGLCSGELMMAVGRDDRAGAFSVAAERIMMRGRRKILFCSSVKLGVLLLSTILAVTAGDCWRCCNHLHRGSAHSNKIRCV